MAKKGARIPLNVYLNGRLVGRLRRETSGAIDFQYDQSWLDWEHTFPASLSLPLREDRYVGDPVIAVFDNLLPDSKDVRDRVAERAHADGADAYNLLAAIGRDCVGALQFLPDGDDPGKAGELKARPISNNEIADTLSNLASAPLGMGEDKEFRISIAGAQDKTALLHWKGEWHIPHGTTATTHIFKPQIGQRGNYDLTHSVENEHMCLEILGALGLPVAKTQILDFAGTRALVIARFDREWTKDGRLLRVPQEDCCQALSVPPTRKYQSDLGPGMVDIFEFLKASDDPAHDQTVFLRAQIAFWLLAATDGHAKNFSVFLRPGGGFELTPLYDVMSAQHIYDNKQIQKKDFRLAMSVGKNKHYQLHGIQPRHFLQTAERAGLPEGMATMALDQIADSLPDAIETVCAALPPDFPADIRESIVEAALNRRDIITTAAAGDPALG
ncbi:MAG TPA: type II toxin-antitoxin system HipA family toxin [Gammaproteobacteria bacterium]|nr:type II toxin-antitoxin system HipA family toxin [Gammaproteobacteria bacterium]